MLFANQDRLDDGALLEYAARIGLDQTVFRSCFYSSRAENKVRDDLVFALGHGIRGTPTYVISGRWFEGVQDEGFLRGVLDSAVEAGQ